LLPGPVEPLFQVARQDLDPGSLVRLFPEGKSAEQGIHAVVPEKLRESGGLLRTAAEEERTDSSGLPLQELSRQGSRSLSRLS